MNKVVLISLFVLFPIYLYFLNWLCFKIGKKVWRLVWTFCRLTGWHKKRKVYRFVNWIEGKYYFLNYVSIGASVLLLLGVIISLCV